jgi:hypothetical protein
VKMLIGSGAGSLRPGEISGFRELDVSGVRTGESARGGLTFWGIWPIVVPSWRGPRLCFATGILTAALPHRCRPLARGWKSPGTSLSTNVINTKQNRVVRCFFFCFGVHPPRRSTAIGVVIRVKLIVRN